MKLKVLTLGDRRRILDEQSPEGFDWAVQSKTEIAQDDVLLGAQLALDQKALDGAVEEIKNTCQMELEEARDLAFCNLKDVVEAARRAERERITPLLIAGENTGLPVNLEDWYLIPKKKWEALKDNGQG